MQGRWHRIVVMYVCRYRLFVRVVSVSVEREWIQDRSEPQTESERYRVREIQNQKHKQTDHVRMWTN